MEQSISSLRGSRLRWTRVFFSALGAQLCLGCAPNDNACSRMTSEESLQLAEQNLVTQLRKWGTDGFRIYDGEVSIDPKELIDVTDEDLEAIDRAGGEVSPGSMLVFRHRSSPEVKFFVWIFPNCKTRILFSGP